METTALYIGYAILAIIATGILLFAFALGWFAIHEAWGIIASRKWRKRKLRQLKLETARDCAYHLARWEEVKDMTPFQAMQYFDNKLREEKI